MPHLLVAATTTREGFGGSVTVTTPGDSSRGTSKGTRNTPQSGRGHDGRGRSQSGRRPNDRTKGPRYESGEVLCVM